MKCFEADTASRSEVLFAPCLGVHQASVEHLLGWGLSCHCGASLGLSRPLPCHLCSLPGALAVSGGGWIYGLQSSFLYGLVIPTLQWRVLSILVERLSFQPSECHNFCPGLQECHFLDVTAGTWPQPGSLSFCSWGHLM